MKTNSDLARLPRFGFRDGWLYFRRKKGLFRFRGWPRLEVEYRSAGEEWCKMDVVQRDKLVGEFWTHYRTSDERALIPEGDAFRDADSGQMCMPWTVADEERCFLYGSYHWGQFLKSLPDSFVTHAQRLRCDFFSALDLLHEAPVAMDLTQHNPMLASALARHWEFPAVGRVDWDAVRRQLRNRRRDIIGWLGYSASEATVKALERVTILSTHVAAIIQRSLAVLNDTDFGPALAHVPLTDEMVIDCLSNPLTHKWLEPHRLKKAGPKILDCVLSLFEPINTLLAAGALDLDSARQLSWGKSDLRTSKWILPYLKPHVLPDGPTPTSWSIERLRSLTDLIREGEEMGHCVGSMLYLLRAADGDVAVYRVTSPVRATLALMNCKQGYWQIEDIKGPHNAEISLEHLAEIARAFPPEVEFNRWIQDRLWDAA